jgi:hypothetical protein
MREISFGQTVPLASFVALSRWRARSEPSMR